MSVFHENFVFVHEFSSATTKKVDVFQTENRAQTFRWQQAYSTTQCPIHTNSKMNQDEAPDKDKMLCNIYCKY